MPNRLLLHDRIGRAIASARRRASALALLFLDVDCFKCINDSLGHAAGDQDLQVTASVGIAVYPADGTDAVTLLRKADLALLRAKPDRVAWPRRSRAAGL